MTHNYRILLHYYYFLCTFSVQNCQDCRVETVKPLCAILANLSVHFLCYLCYVIYLFGYLFMYFYISLLFFFM